MRCLLGVLVSGIIRDVVIFLKFFLYAIGIVDNVDDIM